MLAGLLFGYDQGVIAGALQWHPERVRHRHHAGRGHHELGDARGVVRCARRRRARRQAGRAASRSSPPPSLFIVGAALEAFAPGPPVLVVGRLTVGFGVGVASVAAPLYAAEMAPAHLRGRFVSMYQLAITVGIFIAYAVDQALTNSDAWRAMLGVSAVPGHPARSSPCWPMPESPRWLHQAATACDDGRGAVSARCEPDVDVDARVDRDPRRRSPRTPTRPRGVRSSATSCASR